MGRGCRCVESRPTTMPRRFPPPWTAEETDTCFIEKPPRFGASNLEHVVAAIG